MRKFSTNKLCILALCSVINLIGGQIALLLRLPIYLDSFGTVFAAAVMGPFYGMIPGIVSNLIGGVTTDIYALYYLPVQMITGCLAGFVFRKMPPHGGKDLGFFMHLCILRLVQLFHHLGLGLTASVCMVQGLTDYADRAIVLALTAVLLALLPSSVKAAVNK